MAVPETATAGRTAATPRTGSSSRASGKGLGQLLTGGKLLVLPWSAWLLALYALPIGFVVMVSFWTMDGQVLTPGFTLENYRTIFSGEGGDLGLLMRTCLIALLVVAIVTLICYPIAYFLVFRMTSLGASATALTLIALPFLVGPLIRSIAWKGLLGVQGVINGLLKWVGVVEEPLEWLLFSRFSVVVALIYNTYPFMLFALVLSMQTIDRNLVTAARDLGAGAFTAFRKVILPLSVPGLLIGYLLAFVPAVSASLEPEMLGGTEGRAFTNAISDRIILTTDWPAGAAMTTVFTVVATTVCVIVAGLLLFAFRGVFGAEGKHVTASPAKEGVK